MEIEKSVQVCIIGAGTAGMAAAYALRNRGFSIAVVEKQKTLGGTAVNAWVETWIEGINPPYLLNILGRITSLTSENIDRSWLPSNFALDNKGGVKLFIPHNQLSEIYRDDMEKDADIELLCGYSFKEAVICTDRIQSIRVVNVADASEVIKITACFFIDCSGGELSRFSGKKDIDYFLGEDPYSRFEELLMYHTTQYSKTISYEFLNEPSLFFKVGSSGEKKCNNPIGIDNQNKIDSSVDYLYNGYNAGCWVNPMTGMNLSGKAVINLGEDETYRLAVSHIHSYWEFICKEIKYRHNHNLDLYGFTLADVNLIPQSDSDSYAKMLGIRETYRINCHYMITEHDLSKSILEYELCDNIACGSHGIDFHTYGNLRANDVAEFNRKKLRPSGIPYRSLVPKLFSNVLVAGRAFGASHIALSARRVNKDMSQLGWAAGNAIRICLEQNRNDTLLSPQNVSLLQSDDYTCFAKNVDYLKTLCDREKTQS